MKITIIQSEIEEAIQNHLMNAINLPEGKGFHIDLTATRGANGITAEIEIIDKNTYKESSEDYWCPGGSETDESDLAKMTVEEEDQKSEETAPTTHKGFFADLKE